MATTKPRSGYSKDQHEAQASSYGRFEPTPFGILEHQLHESALGDCTDLTVLDLGGGQGLRARQAVDHGAKAVDVVDLSPEMMHMGQKIEESLGRGNKVLRWFEADVSKPEELARVPLRFKEEGYDMVMSNWLFDHAGDMAMLDGMLRSIVAYLKPGGRFIGTRAFNTPRAPAMTSSKYGATFKDFEEIPGGLAYRYVLHMDPPVQYDAASMEATYNPAKMDELHAKYGLEDTQIEPYGNASWIRSDPDYWKLFLDQPSIAIVKARKKLH
ncbi:hypothetical protein VMCG_07973 [Cytospora schulzeri]|uniref:Methyltransferase domain-containing protein n=1 Tax=Cytospora schulzeri TaxID=448051 RepID=A0A423VY66_9PEZI|nr:hypothetical protein VMCG_07973 [Valsa malicola]